MEAETRIRESMKEELERVSRNREVELNRKMQDELGRAVKEARDKAREETIQSLKMTKEEQEKAAVEERRREEAAEAEKRKRD